MNLYEQLSFYIYWIPVTVMGYEREREKGSMDEEIWE